VILLRRAAELPGWFLADFSVRRSHWREPELFHIQSHERYGAVSGRNLSSWALQPLLVAHVCIFSSKVELGKRALSA
jgi:hypothetical protein